jgi:hypothetical protein
MNRHRQVLAVVGAASLFALLPATPAAASWGEVKCAVGIPAAQAASAAARIGLRAAEDALPSATKRLEEARLRLKKATSTHNALVQQAAAAPNDLALADRVQRSETTLQARRAAVASASAALSAAKVAVPKARSAAQSAERKLKELRTACPQ